MIRHQTIRFAKTTAFTLAVLLLVGMISSGCGDHPPLPTAIENNIDNFGANDTSFVRITPDWDAAHGYNWTSPADILVGPDGFVFVIDLTTVGSHSNGRVVQLSTTGSTVRSDLFTAVTDTTDAPLGIGQDTKLNLFMVNGTDHVYCWNQYVAQTGPQELIQTMTLVNPDAGDTIVVDNNTPLYEQLLGVNVENYVTVDYTSTTDPDSLQSLGEPYLFYIDRSYGNGAALSPKLTDVAGGPAQSNRIYVTDQQDDRISEIAVAPVRLMVLKNGVAFYTFTGLESNVAVGSGQGQGSANSPTSIAVQGSGSSTSLYFAQTAGNFRVQRVSGSGSNWYYDFQQGDGATPELLTLDYFNKPVAVAVGERDTRGLGLIYVADQAQNRVTAFFPSGFKFREVAVSSELIDLTAGQSISDYMTAQGEELDEVLNPGLVDFVAARPEDISLDSLQSFASELASLGISYGSLIDPPVSQDYIASQDTSFLVSVAVDSTVKLYKAILNAPQGVATAEGVVYISDTGNDRILRYIRTDVNSYLPTEQQ